MKDDPQAHFLFCEAETHQSPRDLVVFLFLHKSDIDSKISWRLSRYDFPPPPQQQRWYLISIIFLDSPKDRHSTGHVLWMIFWTLCRCIPLDSLSSVGGSCLECVRLFVGGTYGGGVIVPGMIFGCFFFLGGITKFLESDSWLEMWRNLCIV